jgi:hypothetical protein
MAGGVANHCFHPPFNLISDYREPGKINLNTIYTPEVLQGLLNVVPDPNAPGYDIKATNINNPSKDFFYHFVKSRRGYDSPTTPNDILAGNAAFPTEFAQPFHASSENAALIPPGMGIVPHREINATVFRNATYLDGSPLDSSDSTADAHPLFQHLSSTPADNTQRNPYYSYQALERLANSITTRSNVYAVWITEGYFEVTPKTRTSTETVDGIPDAAHPDGYQLGRELGSDTGETRRHRAFYIIDRSIPVGFQRGQDLNDEKAILLKRIIE